MTESSSIPSPEKRLAIAILDRAIKDYKKGRYSAKRFLFPDEGDDRKRIDLWTQVAEIPLHSIQKKLKSEEEKSQMRVKVYSGDQKIYLGEGKVVGKEELIAGDESLGTTPKIIMNDGKVVYGHEVWWIDIEEAEKMEAKFEEENNDGSKTEAQKET